MTDIRTPDDEPKPGVLLPPFREGWIYHGATYPGHSDGAVDFNRRGPQGQWIQDEGDPVLAPADGTVAEVNKAEGLVVLAHGGGLRTEFRHMTGIPVTKGQRVERSDRIGNIGNVGNSTSPHLHMRAYRNGKPIRLPFEGQPVRTSILDSDTKPATWDPPAPVAVVGPPPKATWKGAFEEAAKRLEKVTAQRDDARAQAKLATDERDEARRMASDYATLSNDLRSERDTARAEVALLTTTVAELRTALTTTEAALVECRNQTVPDCSAVQAQLDEATRWNGELVESMDRRTQELQAAEAARDSAHRKLVLIRNALDAA